MLIVDTAGPPPTPEELEHCAFGKDAFRPLMMAFLTQQELQLPLTIVTLPNRKSAIYLNVNGQGIVFSAMQARMVAEFIVDSDVPPKLRERCEALRSFLLRLVAIVEPN